MYEDQNSTALYWEEGPFRVCIESDASVPQDLVNEAVAILERFRHECLVLSSFFYLATGGLDEFRKRNADWIEQSGENTYFFGTQVPDQPQSRGRSTVSQISRFRLRELLDSGEAYDMQAKLTIVYIYHLWEDNYRAYVAKRLSLDKNQVECDLMGDIRLVRNEIVHNNSQLDENTINELKMLPSIWNLRPGTLVLSNAMFHALMEQLNAIRIRASAYLQ